MRTVYDPRTNEYVVSNNPALILADEMCKTHKKSVLDPEYWLLICYMANYMEDYV